MTQSQAAKGAGISQAEWQKLESNQVKRIGLNMARRVVAYMAGIVSLEDLDARGRLPRPADSTDTAA